MSLPSCYVLMTPEPSITDKHAIRKLHHWLDQLQIHPLLRRDLAWLQVNLWRRFKNHPAYRKIMRILLFLGKGIYVAINEWQDTHLKDTNGSDATPLCPISLPRTT